MITLTREAWKKFAPGCPAAWTEALFGNLDLLTEHGILETELRWCHFAGTVWAETGNFKELRENLYYVTLGALRRAWPSRFGHMPDSQARAFLRNPRALANKTYNGRMGNRPGSSDGYDYRGGGWINTTGRDAVEAYCKQLGITPGPTTLDDPVITLQFAVLEWTDKKCNDLADQNDILKIAKAINVGSADSNVIPNGMDNRREGFARAWKLWGEYDADAPKVAAKPTSKKMTTAIATASASAVSLLSSTVSTDPLGTAEKAVSTGQRVQAVAEQGGGLLQAIGSIGHASGIGLSVLLAAGICGGLYWVFGHWLPSKFGSSA
jgi:putative chitinase